MQLRQGREVAAELLRAKLGGQRLQARKARRGSDVMVSAWHSSERRLRASSVSHGTYLIG